MKKANKELYSKRETEFSLSVNESYITPTLDNHHLMTLFFSSSFFDGRVVKSEVFSKRRLIFRFFKGGTQLELLVIFYY